MLKFNAKKKKKNVDIWNSLSALVLCTLEVQRKLLIYKYIMLPRTCIYTLLRYLSCSNIHPLSQAPFFIFLVLFEWYNGALFEVVFVDSANIYSYICNIRNMRIM